jgi:peptidoglycan/LPS O-acetylase OafA/YrhL
VNEGADTGHARRGLAHVPALDGLRGVAVVLVVLFHHGFAWARGGFVGVSVFFTLSGFLVTALLVDEHERTGRIGLRSFWARRARRLVPAAFVATAVTAAVWLVLRDDTLPTRIHGDVLAVLTSSANWWFVWEDRSDADLFRSPSPLLHHWSLAVEQQLYLLWPIALVGLLRVVRRPGRQLAAVAMLTAASVLVGLLTTSADLRYYGTHVRAAEFLLGAVLAL